MDQETVQSLKSHSSATTASKKVMVLETAQILQKKESARVALATQRIIYPMNVQTSQLWLATIVKEKVMDLETAQSPENHWSASTVSKKATELETAPILQKQESALQWLATTATEKVTELETVQNQRKTDLMEAMNNQASKDKDVTTITEAPNLPLIDMYHTMNPHTKVIDNVNSTSSSELALLLWLSF